MTAKADIINADGSQTGNSLELPAVFDTPYRPEVIHKVYVNLLSHSFQQQGRYPAAGEMVSAQSRNTGLGIARLARARGEGFPRAGQAAGVAGVRHGRVAHPPESWKIIYKRINKKEKALGLCSSIAATARKDLVLKRGHIIEGVKSFPIVISNDIENITTAKELEKALISIGLKDDLQRAKNSRKARSGTSRRRSRVNRPGKSLLLVVANNEKIGRLKSSIPGVDIKMVNELSVLDFVPGSKPIRLTAYSSAAIDKLKELRAPVHRIMEVAVKN